MFFSPSVVVLKLFEQLELLLSQHKLYLHRSEFIRIIIHTHLRERKNAFATHHTHLHIRTHKQTKERVSDFLNSLEKRYK